MVQKVVIYLWMAYHNIVCVLLMSSLHPYNVYTVKECLDLLKKESGFQFCKHFMLNSPTVCV